MDHIEYKVCDECECKYRPGWHDIKFYEIGRWDICEDCIDSLRDCSDDITCTRCGEYTEFAFEGVKVGKDYVCDECLKEIGEYI